MLTTEDRIQLQQKGITPAQFQAQLNAFAKGFPYLQLQGPAAIGKGILALQDHEVEHYLAAWDEYKHQGHTITKFVPASGAASRMFKGLFAFAAGKEADRKVKAFFEGIHQFAFFAALDEACQQFYQMGVDELIAQGRHRDVAQALLSPKGLNYGQLPKGLLLFHSTPTGPRTPLEEHLVEAALYASSQGETQVHFTVSAEHRALFADKVDQVVKQYEQEYGIHFHVTFSEQMPSTDTVAVCPDGTPFRTDDGRLLFRPGGHGALIHNLNQIESDIVFIKNIDNVVPDTLKGPTVQWKQVLAGLLVDTQRQAFAYLELLDSGEFSHADLEDMIRFVRHSLGCNVPGLKHLSDQVLKSYLRTKLDRPIRVCGVVKNVGEPGGGPFLAMGPDGCVNNQILESSQIDMSNPEYRDMLARSTHFNPVDLVCSLRNYRGEPYPLKSFVDLSTGFISTKSKDGRELRALELPGLWNGAMSDWSTIFVEVPLDTFNPVKTVTDLLRPQHQSSEPTM